MDRMSFVPGQEARDEIFNAGGHIAFDRKAALDFADTFIKQAPLGCGGPLQLVYQTMLACLSEGDVVHIWFGLRKPSPAQHEDDDPAGEHVGYTWASHRNADGRERCLYEVGRQTPAWPDAHATRAFNAYRTTLAAFLGHQPPPQALALPSPSSSLRSGGSDVKSEFNGKPTISRALAPSNLYYASARMWYFVDLCPPGQLDTPAILSRPMRAFDALILSALMTLAMGSPPLVFGISNAPDGLGKMPVSFTRAYFEGDERLEPAHDRPILVM